MVISFGDNHGDIKLIHDIKKRTIDKDGFNPRDHAVRYSSLDTLYDYYLKEEDRPAGNHIVTKPKSEQHYTLIPPIQTLALGYPHSSDVLEKAQLIFKDLWSRAQLAVDQEESLVRYIMGVLVTAITTVFAYKLPRIYTQKRGLKINWREKHFQRYLIILPLLALISGLILLNFF